MGILSSEPSLWAELWEYFINRYINPPLPYFNNISNRLEAWTVVLGIACVFIGIIAAGVFLVVYKRMLGALPKALFDLGALSEESAVVPREIGLKIPALLRFSLRHTTSPLRRYIRYVGQKDVTFEEQLMIDKAKKGRATPDVDFRSASIYLVNDRKEECLRRFSLSGSDGKSLAILISVFTVLFFVVCRFLPDLMLIFDGILGLYR